MVTSYHTNMVYMVYMVYTLFHFSFLPFCTRGSADGCLPPPLQVHDTVLLRAPEPAGTIGREKREEGRGKGEERREKREGGRGKREERREKREES